VRFGLCPTEDPRLGAPQKLDGKQETFPVTRVQVTICDAHERVIEEGEGVSDRAGRWWTYTTRVPGNGASINAVAYDLAENESGLTVQRN
jgi:hypothetical protein